MFYQGQENWFLSYGYEVWSLISSDNLNNSNFWLISSHFLLRTKKVIKNLTSKFIINDKISINILSSNYFVYFYYKKTYTSSLKQR